MKRWAAGVLGGVLGLAMLFAAPAARAEITGAELDGFEKGKTTLADITTKLGDPAKTLTNDEGLKAIVYVDPAAPADPDAAASIFGIIGKLASNADQSGGLSTFVFDRAERLIYFRAIVGKHLVTSEDGASPLPNVTYEVTEQQSKASVAQQAATDKPRLGIQFFPTANTGDQLRREFDAAKFTGLIVANVLPASPAEKAGIRDDDLIYLINGFFVASFDDAAKVMATVKKGDKIRIRARRVDQTSRLVSEQVFDVQF